MTRRPSAAAALLAAAALALVAYAFRHEIERLIVGAAFAGVGYRMLTHRFFPSRRHGRVRRGVIELAAAGLVGWLGGRRSGSSTHPCGQCGHPIGAPSRAEYCSPACRRYARLERAETARQAEALERWGDVPF